MLLENKEFIPFSLQLTEEDDNPSHGIMKIELQREKKGKKKGLSLCFSSLLHEIYLGYFAVSGQNSRLMKTNVFSKREQNVVGV